MIVESITLEWQTEPSDATITFSPELDSVNLNSGNWKLGSELGNKTLSILLKKR